MGILLMVSFAVTPLLAAKGATPQVKTITITDESTSKKFNVKGTVVGDYFQTNTPLIITTQSGDTVISGTYVGNEDYAYISGSLYLSDRKGNQACVEGRFMIIVDGEITSKRERSWRNSNDPLFQMLSNGGTSILNSKRQETKDINSKQISAKKKKWNCLRFLPMDDGDIKISSLEYSDKVGYYSCVQDTLYIDFEKKGKYALRELISASSNNRYSIRPSLNSSGDDRYDCSLITLKTASDCWFDITLPPVLYDVMMIYNNEVKVICDELICKYGQYKGSYSRFETFSGSIVIVWPSPSKDISSVWAELNFGKLPPEDHVITPLSEEGGWLGQCPSVGQLVGQALRNRDSTIKWFYKTNDGKTYSISGSKWRENGGLPEKWKDQWMKILDRSYDDRLDWYSVYFALSKVKNSYEEEVASKKQNEKIQEELMAEARNKKRKELIAKYGEKYADAILDKKVMVGMNKAMVEECVSPLMYTITDNGSSQVWMINYEKAEMVFAAEAGKNKQEKEFAQALLSAQLMGKSLGEAIAMVIPKIIVFSGNNVKSVTYN